MVHPDQQHPQIPPPSYRAVQRGRCASSAAFAKTFIARAGDRAQHALTDLGAHRVRHIKYSRDGADGHLSSGSNVEHGGRCERLGSTHLSGKWVRFESLQVETEIRLKNRLSPTHW